MRSPFHRQPHTTAERRASIAAQQDGVKVRAARTNLPHSHTSICRDKKGAWKDHRRTQYRPITKPIGMVLVYQPVGLCWRFFFGDQVCPLSDESVSFQTRADAVDAAARHNLIVNPDNTVKALA